MTINPHDPLGLNQPTTSSAATTDSSTITAGPFPVDPPRRTTRRRSYAEAFLRGWVLGVATGIPAGALAGALFVMVWWAW
jgi:hypothetical protein